MVQKEMDEKTINEQENKYSELLPYSRITKILKLTTDQKFSKSSTQLIQCSVTNFVKEISKLSEKQSRIRSRKIDKDQNVTIQKEDVIAAIQKGGKKFSFINFSTEFLEESFWRTETNNNN